MSSEQQALILPFLASLGWDKAQRVALVQDASPRQYVRLQGPKGRAILMSAPPAPVQPYAARAKLASNDCGAFVCLARELSQRGFLAPEILGADLEQGLVLLEDLGDDLFFDVIKNDPSRETELYEAAVSTLAALARSTFGPQARYQDHGWPIRAYDEEALLAETELLLDWYLPEANVTLSEHQQQALQATWAALFTAHLAGPPVLVLRDYHAQNLLWLPERDGLARVGLLDFQDAVFGHPAYDLLSLLQDARRDVSPALETPLIAQFVAQAKLPDLAAFTRAYHVLGAQRAAKILGIFVRLARRDGKQRYLSLLPRVEAQFVQNLLRPELAPLTVLLRPLLPNLFARVR
jgi:aminoglycoside/choline kinase family phosphotransferase